MEELSLVLLRHDLPAHGLVSGAVGTIVLVHSDGEAYEVEFVRAGGKPPALLTLTGEDVGPLSGARTSDPHWISSA